MMQATGLFFTCVLNILANHMLLTTNRTKKYCLIVFILNTIFAFGAGLLAFERITNQVIRENILTLLGFSYVVYICLVFKESFSKKIFTMFSVWIFSYISFFIAVQIALLFPGIVANSDVISFTLMVRFIIQLLLLSVVYIWLGDHYNKIINLVPDRIINFMSIYLIIAFMMLKSTSFVQLYDFKHIAIVLLFITSIIMGYLAVFLGISASSKVELQRYDELTGIVNRSSIMEHLARTVRISIRNKLKFALLVCDLDDFKKINDEYGHMIGDKALKYVAQSILRVLRSTDAAGRFGGDEFMIIQQYIREESDIEALVSRIFEELEVPFKIDGREIRINLSIGISIFPDDNTDMEVLISQADRAMYEAKKRDGCACDFYEAPGPLGPQSEFLYSKF